MKNVVIVAAILATTLASATAQAGTFGRRWSPPAQQQGRYRSNSYQPTLPFSSRSDPRDWREAHRGYGIKIRGW
jgi:hypothetical protein